MPWIEDLLILLGIGSDVFAAMECQGSVVRTIEKRRLCLSCLVVAISQILTFGCGYLAAVFVSVHRDTDNEVFIGHILAVGILIVLGVRLILKALKNERIDERLDLTTGVRQILRLSCTTGGYTFLSGLALGFLDTTWMDLLTLIPCTTIVLVATGMYTGFRYGFEEKTKAYIVGAVLLIGVAAELGIRYFTV